MNVVLNVSNYRIGNIWKPLRKEIIKAFFKKKRNSSVKKHIQKKKDFLAFLKIFFKEKYFLVNTKATKKVTYNAAKHAAIVQSTETEQLNKNIWWVHLILFLYLGLFNHKNFEVKAHFDKLNLTGCAKFFMFTVDLFL